VRADQNRGFVATCNWGCERHLVLGNDLLLLNSDTEVTAGFLDEMQELLYLHEKHAIVTPRSNSATIFSVPWSGERLNAAESHSLWQEIRPLLPRYQVMPTAVGFCMLIRGDVLKRFELFDEVYSPGYNEENDFVCRINRYGYSVLAANWAFVFHHESSSFGARRGVLEAAHRKELLKRFPEYSRKIADYERFYVDPVENFAILYKPHRPRILYDLFHLPAAHTGTSDFGLNLLREIRRLVEDEFELHVGISQPERFFDHELAGYRIYDDSAEAQMRFDLLFKPCQVFLWADFRRMIKLSPRVSYVLQDIIGVRCEYLNSPNRQFLFRTTAEYADCVFTISEFSHSDFEAFYGEKLPMRVIYHGTNVGSTPAEFQEGSYVLIMGNYFVHKGVADALRALDDKDLSILVLGGETKPASCGANVRWMTSGNLSRQQMRELLVKARLLIYPSHYEGFGLPVLDALALGKPVIVLESEVNRELAALVREPNFHRIDSVSQLPGKVRELLAAPPPSRPDVPPRRWKAAAEEYVAAFHELLERDIDVNRLRARWNLVRSVEALNA
jgi:GT2 family glycosyltransferase